MIYTRSRLKTYYINLNIQYFCSCRVDGNEPSTCHDRNFESWVHVTTPFKGLQNNIFLGDFQLTGEPWDNILWRWRDRSMSNELLLCTGGYTVSWNANLFETPWFWPIWMPKQQIFVNFELHMCLVFETTPEWVVVSFNFINCKVIGNTNKAHLQKLKRVINLHVIRLQQNCSSKWIIFPNRRNKLLKHLFEIITYCPNVSHFHLNLNQEIANKNHQHLQLKKPPLQQHGQHASP